MIKSFKDFNVQDYLNSLKEAVDTENLNVDQLEFSEEDVISGTPVYSDKYLLKISNIVNKYLKSANIGKFGIYHDVVYLNDVPGVWFYGLDGNNRNIVCCRSTNIKTISIFNEFTLGSDCKALITYSTEKLGFKDMLDQMIEDLKETNNVSESVLLEAAFRSTTGYGKKHVERFEKLTTAQRDYLYNLVRTQKKSAAQMLLFSDYTRGDSVVVDIFNKYNGSTSGDAKYMVGIAYDVMNGTYASEPIFDKLISEYSGGAPVIATSVGTSYSVADYEADMEARRADMEARRADEIKKDTEEYQETLLGLKETSEAMCNYVKQNGKLNADDESAMRKRGILLTGKGGIGKTYTLKKVLKEKGMVENKDYLWISSDSTTSDALYQAMYEYNGKLIIFDDAPKLFDGEYRISLWKNALQTDLEDCRIGYPKSEKSSLNVYNVKRVKNRQRRYFMEIGQKSDEEKSAFYKKEMNTLGLKFGSDGKVKSIELRDASEIDTLMKSIDEKWEEAREDVKPAMPNNFLFKGVVIIISNDSREKFRTTVGDGGWDAIRTRFINYDVSPMSQSLWVTMKEMILNEFNDSSISDDLCTIPRNITEEFIEEVESLIVDPKYDGMNWRTICTMGKVLRGKPGLRTWKKTLRDELDTTN